jgi:hypothetical protein
MKTFLMETFEHGCFLLRRKRPCSFWEGVFAFEIEKQSGVRLPFLLTPIRSDRSLGEFGIQLFS